MLGFAVVHPAMITANNPVAPRTALVIAPESRINNDLFNKIDAVAPMIPALPHAKKCPINIP